MITEFTPLQSAAGGVLIGASAVLLMAVNGRIAGLTGILGGLVVPEEQGRLWRMLFLAGAILAPVLLGLAGYVPAFSVPVSTSAMLVGGFLVGIGATFGGGCPSGHGVCGLSRLSVRSLVAVLTFMATAAATVFITRHMWGA